MPFKSEAQRRFMHAKHPEIAERWEHEYPRKKKLPYHAKKAYDEGVGDALRTFGLGKAGAALDRSPLPARDGDGAERAGAPGAAGRGKVGAEEIRLKIPKREFHGFDAAFQRAAAQANDKTKTAEDQDDEVTMPLPQQASEDQPVEKLVKMLQELPDPKGTNVRETNRDESADSLAWTTPESLTLNQVQATGSVF